MSRPANRTYGRTSAAVLLGLFVLSGCQAPPVPPDTQARNCVDSEALAILIDATDPTATQARAQLMSGIGDGACFEEQELLALIDAASASGPGEDTNPLLLFADDS